MHSFIDLSMYLSYFLFAICIYIYTNKPWNIDLAAVPCLNVFMLACQHDADAQLLDARAPAWDAVTCVARKKALELGTRKVDRAANIVNVWQTRRVRLLERSDDRAAIPDATPHLQLSKKASAAGPYITGTKPSTPESIGPNNHQFHFEVHFRYVILQL